LWRFAGLSRSEKETNEPVPKIKLGPITTFDKLRANGFDSFVVSLSNRKALEHPDLGWLHDLDTLNTCLRGIC
jgi:hypothetical protein